MTRWLANHRQSRSWAADRFAALLKAGFNILLKLLGRLEEQIVGPVLFVFAVGRRMLAANLWPRFIDAAAIIRPELPALGVELQVPRLFFNEDTGLAMQQEPAERVEIFSPLGRVKRQSEIPAALRHAVIAETLAGRHLF